jgi:hypothetical protein
MFISRRCWAALGAGVLLAVSPTAAGAASAHRSFEQPAPPVGIPGGGSVGGIGVPGTDGPSGGNQPSGPSGSNSPLPGGLGNGQGSGQGNGQGNGQGDNQSPVPAGVGGEGNPLSGSGLMDGPQQGPLGQGQDKPAGQDKDQPSDREQPASHGGPAEPSGPAPEQPSRPQADPQADAPKSNTPQSDAPQAQEPQEPASGPTNAGPSDDSKAGGAGSPEASEGDGQNAADQAAPSKPKQESHNKLFGSQSHDRKGGPLRTGQHPSHRSGQSSGHERTHRQDRPGMDAEHAGDSGWNDGDGDGNWGDDSDGPGGGGDLISTSRH